MSSTYANVTSSSLPSDYALLSQYATARNAREPGTFRDHQDELSSETETDEINDAHESLTRSSQLTHGLGGLLRRSSFPVHPYRPQNPTMAPSASKHIVMDKTDLPSETTPLLNPLVPRIEEEVDAENCSEGNEPPSRHRHLRMYWEEGKILVKYTLPVFGTHVLEYSLMITTVVSIGHLSTTALAAATLGTMTAGVTAFSIIHGFASSLDTLLPSAWTSEEPRFVGLWAQRIMVVLAAIMIPITAVWTSSESILLFLKQDPEVARLAAIYLHWMLLGLPAYAFNVVSRRYFQSQGLMDVPTRILIVVAPLNVLFNYLLVWGPNSIRLGFIGAPIATVMSMNLISFASLIYGVFFVPKRAWHPLSMRAFKNLDVVAKLGLAGVGQVASEWWSWELVALAASLLGPVALATQSVLLTSASTLYQAPYALSIAVSVRIGNLLGERNAHRAKVTAQTSLVVALLLAGINTTILLVFRKNWAYLFNDDEEVVKLVAQIMPLVALFQVFDGLAGCSGGILRAVGKQYVGALLNLSAYYVLGIPFGVWLAFQCGLALAGLWIGLTVSLVYCAVIGVYVCLRTDWTHEVKKVLERLARDGKDGKGPVVAA